MFEHLQQLFASARAALRPILPKWLRGGVPIVPVAMKNTDVLMGKGTGVAKMGTIEMVLLSAVETTGVSTDEDLQRLVEQVQQVIAQELGVKEITKR